MSRDVVYIGVDPGKTGFISIEVNEKRDFIKMPYHKIPTGKFTKTGKPITKDEFHEEGFLDIFIELTTRFRTEEIKVAIEEVGGRGGWSATNNFNFGYVAGMLKQLFILLGAEIIMVRPQKWQTYMRQGYPDLKKASSTGKTQVRDPKAVAQLIVETEFPEVDFRKTERAKKNDDNKIDSFLILQYLIRTSKK